MKIALISVSSKGTLLVQTLAQNIDLPVDIYAKSECDLPQAANSNESLSDLISRIFHEYDGMIFVMPVSMAVRVIAPCICDKRFDPAVVVVDEAGEYVISLLDGHGQAAHRLTMLAANAIGAQPIMTSVIDHNFLPFVDVLAVKLGLAIEPFDQLQLINTMIRNDDKVVFFIDNSLVNTQHFIRLAADLGVTFKDITALVNAHEYDAAVVISDKQLYMVKPHIYLRPATLAVGLECQPGSTSAHILTALSDSCRKIGRSTKSIAVIATNSAYQDEVGLLATVQQLEVPVEFFTSEQLAQCADHYRFSQSPLLSADNVDKVSEPAALCAGQSERLLMRAANYGAVKVAIAEVNHHGWD